jgi:hypothetical protein
VQLSFRLREPADLDRVAFRNTQSPPPQSWVREVEVLLSATGEEAGGWIPVGRWTLAQTTAPQEFTFRPTLARAVKLRVLARHGDASFTSLGAFAIERQAQVQSPLLAD